MKTTKSKIRLNEMDPREIELYLESKAPELEISAKDRDKLRTVSR